MEEAGVQKKMVLLVEDEEPMIQALTDTFVNSGFRVEKANNGEVGLNIAFRDHPDLIILDILMPELDGMTLIQKLRQDSWGSTVPVIILSNVNPETDKMLQDIMQSSPAYYLIKSNVSLQQILDKAKDIFEKKLPNV